jgi:hypothetical protein
MGTRENFGAAISCERRGGKQPSDKAQPADDRSAIGLLAQITGIDRRRLSGIARFGLDVAARQRPHLPSPGGDAWEIVELADLAVLEAARRKLHWTSGVADSSSSLTEAAASEAL